MADQPSVPLSRYARSLDEALTAVKEIGFPVIIRPAFTLGGVGGGIAYNVKEVQELVSRGIDSSPVRGILVISWKG